MQLLFLRNLLKKAFNYNYLLRFKIPTLTVIELPHYKIMIIFSCNDNFICLRISKWLDHACPAHQEESLGTGTDIKRKCRKFSEAHHFRVPSVISLFE